MNKADLYLRTTLIDILENGQIDENPRPRYADGTPAHSKFITQTFEKYDILNGDTVIPTLRNTAIKSGIKEILWIYQDASNSLEKARERGINWWDEWDVGDDTIGMAYGAVVERYNLMEDMLQGMLKNKESRRHILNLYQHQASKEQDALGGLNPCFFMTMWTIRPNNVIDVTLFSRSSDFILAGFINRVQYLALAQMVASHLSFHTKEEYKIGSFAVFTQNAHMYLRHEKGVRELLDRAPMDVETKLELNVVKDFYDITLEDFKITCPKIEKLKSELEIAI